MSEESHTLDSLRDIKCTDKLIGIYLDSIKSYVSKEEYYEQIKIKLKEQFEKTAPKFKNVSQMWKRNIYTVVGLKGSVSVTAFYCRY